MEEEKIETAVEEDAELDKALEADLAKLRNDDHLTPPAEVKTEETSETKVEEEPKVEPTVPAKEEEKVVETPKEEAQEFRTPVKGDHESDETYQKRVELFKLINTRKNAKTPEEKQRITEEIANTRKEIRDISKDIKNNPNAPVLEKKSEEELKKEEKIAQDKAYLKSIGAVTREDLDAERFQTEVSNTLKSFVDRHSEFKDEDVREVFFDFVESNYNWQTKSGDALMTVLELAREAMYKPSETMQDKVLKAAGVAEKVNAMQFPGGTIVKKSLTPAQQDSIKELVATGMTEAKALELISD